MIAVRPVSGAAVGVFDLKQKKYIFAGRKWALDVYKDLVAAERKNGELAIYKIGTTEPVANIQLSKSDFGKLRTVSFADDGSMLAVSDRSRGAVWSLPSGSSLLLVRGYRGSYITPDDRLYADFPASGNMQRNIAKYDPSARAVVPGTNFLEDNARQYGRFLLIRRSLDLDDSEKKKGEEKKGQELYSEETRDKAVAIRKTEFEVRDVTNDKVLWSRKFLKRNAVILRELVTGYDLFRLESKRSFC